MQQYDADDKDEAAVMLPYILRAARPQLRGSRLIEEGWGRGGEAGATLPDMRASGPLSRVDGHFAPQKRFLLCHGRFWWDGLVDSGFRSHGSLM